MNGKAKAFRAAMQKKYDDVFSIEQLRDMLIDVLCMLHTEFYIRPRE